MLSARQIRAHSGGMGASSSSSVCARLPQLTLSQSEYKQLQTLLLQREEEVRQLAEQLAQQRRRRQLEQDRATLRALTEQRDALLQRHIAQLESEELLLRESRAGCADAQAAPAQGSAVADEDRVRALLHGISGADAGLAVPAEQLPSLNNGNIARLAPAAHAAAQAQLEQESAGALRIGGPPPRCERTAGWRRQGTH